MIDIILEEQNFKTNEVLIDNLHNVVVFNEYYGEDTIVIPISSVEYIRVPNNEGYMSTIITNGLKFSKEKENNDDN